MPGLETRLPLLSGFLANGHFPRVSHLSADISTGNMETTVYCQGILTKANKYFHLESQDRIYSFQYNTDFINFPYFRYQKEIKRLYCVRKSISHMWGQYGKFNESFFQQMALFVTV